ncbi:McrB [Pseudomonas syringae]|uniref:McrC family protein n=1 Tax=Pseudomonas syringae TaxID=317 RepID=UPI001CA9C782|nr:McrC family protein [Pseudomonas syringae]MCI3944517.1 McrB [Pseudomonas syringae]
MPEVVTWEGMHVPLPADMDPKWVANRLLRLTDSAKFTAFRWKRDGLYAGDVVGCVQIGKLRINILPKLETPEPLRDKLFLLNLLRAAGYIKSAHTGESDVRADSVDILEIVISELAQEMIWALRKGEPRRYEQICEDSLVVRGRIEFMRLSTRLPGLATIPVKHSPLISNNILSSIIKGIALFLHRTTSNMKNRQTLSYILSKLHTTDKKEITTAQIDRLVISRNESHWLRTLEIGRLLLSGQSPDPTFSGKNRAFSLLFPMQHLYERSVRSVLTKALAKSEVSVDRQGRTKFLLKDKDSQKGIIGLRPDYVLTKRGAVIAIADAKWKRVSETAKAHGILRDDFYQIYAYIKKYKVLEAFILTPKAPWMQKIWTKTYLDNNSPAKIHIVGIDLESLISRLHTVRSLSYKALNDTLNDFLKSS